MKDFIEKYLPLTVVLLFFTPPAIIGALLLPVALLFDQRRYKVPRYTVDGDKLGLLRYFCFIHYALKEGGECPNCGYSKNDLTKN